MKRKLFAKHKVMVCAAGNANYQFAPRLKIESRFAQAQTFSLAWHELPNCRFRGSRDVADAVRDALGNKMVLHFWTSGASSFFSICLGSAAGIAYNYSNDS